MFRSTIIAISSILLLASSAYAQDAGSSVGPAASLPAASTPASNALPDKAPLTKEVVVVESQAWWQKALVILIQAAASIAVPVLSLLLVLLLRKWKINVELATMDMILGKAIGFAEQKARNALKDGKPLEGPEIAKQALGIAEELMERYKLTELLKDKLTDLIEAKLGEQKLSGAETPKKEV